MIRKVRKEDTPAITAIYNHYIAHTTITFELEPVSEEEMWTRIQHISEKYPYFVYETEGQIAGYCYVHGWKEKAAYNQSAETPSTCSFAYRERYRKRTDAASNRRMPPLRTACPDSLHHRR